MSLKSSIFVMILATFFVANCLALLCPDQKERCRSGQTCCDNKQGGFGCCPYTNATCCTDGLHCCPTDTYCDLSAARCRRSRQVQITKAELLPQPQPQQLKPKSVLEDESADADAKDGNYNYDSSFPIENNFL